MSSALRTHYDPVQYFVAIADSSSYNYDTSWTIVPGSRTPVGTIYRDLGQIAYWHPDGSTASPATAPPISDVRKVALMTTKGVSTAATDQVWLPLGTRVKATPAQQDQSPAIPPCSIAQIPGIASVRGGR